MKKIITLSLAVFMIAALLCSCSLLESAEKTFTNKGLSITLNESFAEYDHINFTVAYSSAKVAVFALKEEFTLFEGTDYGADTTLDEYANLVIVGNSLEAEISHENDLTSFTYEAMANGDNFTYFATVHKTGDAFWLIQFAVKSDNYESEKDNILAYAKSIAFTE